MREALSDAIFAAIDFGRILVGGALVAAGILGAVWLFGQAAALTAR